MPSEAEIRTYLAIADTVSAEHPDWVAFRAWAQKARLVYDVSRQVWRGQSPAIDVSALEDNYGFQLSPALLSILAQRQV